MSDRTESAPPTLQQAVTRIGGYVWLETALFETLGEWARDGSVEDPAVARMVATHSHHHAWHADLWRDRQPVPPGTPADRLVPRPPPAAAAAIDAIRALGSTVERLVGVYAVLLPRMITDYRALRSTVDPLVDEPTARVLDLVVRDDDDHVAAGTAAIDRLLTTPELTALASSARQQVESALSS